MRHQKNSIRLGRISSHRKAMFRNMATSLLDKSRIETTEVKAKELRRYVERMITLGKRGDLHARRQALSYLRSKDVVGKVFGEYAERFKDRPGGYTRIMKLGTRVGDNARMAIIELMPGEGEKEKAKPKATTADKKKPVAKKGSADKKEVEKKAKSVKKAPEAKAKEEKPKKEKTEGEPKAKKPEKKKEDEAPAT